MSIEKVLANKWFSVFFIVFSFAILFAISDHYYGWTNYKSRQAGMARSDGAGYYGYLPQWYIYKTSNFEFLDSIAKKYPNDGFEDNFRKEQVGYTNKYFCGTAIISIPFYLIGHVHAKIYGADEDGYSWPYLLWMNIGSIFYTLLGVIAMIALGKYWKLNHLGIYLGVIAILYGTILFYYTTAEVPYSHVYSFVVNAWLLYAFLRWKDNINSKWRWLVFISIGLGIIIRPTNALTVLFLPFLFHDWNEFLSWIKSLFKTKLTSLVTGVLLVFLVVSLQLWNIHSQTGKLGFNTYTNEGFDHWKNPYFWSVLFGFNRGLFIYSPVFILLFPGLYAFYKWNKFTTFGFLLTFTVITYVLSSWWCWWYGGSFGLRAFVDYFAFISLPILLFLGKMNWKQNLFVLPIIAVGIYIYQTFDTQYKRNIITYEEMSYEKFKLVFMKTDYRYSWLLHRNIDTISTDFKIRGTFDQLFDPVSKKPTRAFSFEKRDEIDNPISTVRFNNPEKFGEGCFSYRMFSNVKIYGTGIYLSLKTYGYKNGNKVVDQDHPFGHIPREINKWEPVSLDVQTNFYIRDLDSVQIVFSNAVGPSEIRFKSISWGTEPKKN